MAAKDLAFYLPTDENDKHVIKLFKLIADKELSYLYQYNLVISHEQIFDKLVTFRLSGSGRFGEVFEAQFKPEIKIEKETGANKKVALKRVKLNEERGQDEKTMREVLANQKLEKHENIVGFFDYIIHIDNCKIIYLYIIMEYCKLSLCEWFEENDSLEDRVREESFKMFVGIAKGVKFLHGKGLVHRDLKPSNILIDEKGICKIADFGLSKIIPSGFKTMGEYYNTVGVGTPVYASPEQLGDSGDSSNGGNYGRKTDIFPLGCILMQFFTEFSSIEELKSVLKKIRQEHQLPPSMLTHYPNEAQLVLQMTNNDPEKRPYIDGVIDLIGKLN